MEDCRRIARARPQDARTCWFSTIVAVLAYSDGARRVALDALGRAAAWPRGGIRGLLLRALHLTILAARSGDADLQDAVFGSLSDTDLLHLANVADGEDMTFDPFAKCGYHPLRYLERVAAAAGIRAGALDVDGVDEAELRRGDGLVVRDATGRPTWAPDRAVVPSVAGCDLLLVVWRSPYGAGEPRADGMDGGLPPATLTFRGIDRMAVRAGSGAREFRLDAAFIHSRKHSIAGVTCGGRRAVYSGWRAPPGTGRVCGPMPWDWTRGDAEFSLSRRACRLVAPGSEPDASQPLRGGTRSMRGCVWVYVAEDAARGVRKRPREPEPREVSDPAELLVHQVATLVLSAPRPGGLRAALRRADESADDIRDVASTQYVARRFFLAHLGAARRSTALRLASVFTPEALVRAVLHVAPKNRWLASRPAGADVRAADAVAELLWSLCMAEVARVDLPRAEGFGAPSGPAEADVVVAAFEPGAGGRGRAASPPARIPGGPGGRGFALHACARWTGARLEVGVLNGRSGRGGMAAPESPWRDVRGLVAPSIPAPAPDDRECAWIYYPVGPRPGAAA